MSNKPIQWRKMRPVLIALFLALLGFAGNSLSIPVAYSVEFIFGSVFSIIVLRSLGPLAGIVTAFLASTYTYYLWNHPYAIVIFTAEIAWIAVALKLGKKNLILIDTVYWLILGSPLVALFYNGVMHLGTQVTVVIMLKQSINGILNALIASIVLTHTPIISWIRGKKTDQTSSYSLWIFHLITTFLMIPTLVLIFIHNYQNISAVQKQIVRQLIVETNETNIIVTEWIERHVRAVTSISQLDQDRSSKPSEELQAKLKRIHQLFPDFHNVFLGDTTATTYAFYPAANHRGDSTIGLNFADRHWFKQLKQTLKPVISDVFVGRGGVFVPIIAIAVPAVINGKLSHFGVGAINLKNMKNIFKQVESHEFMIQWIVDRHNNVIISSDPSQKPLTHLDNNTQGQDIPIDDGVRLFVPGSRKNISVMSSWKDAYYHTTQPIRGTTWHLQIEYPVGPLQTRFYDMAITSLTTIALIYVIMIALATVLTGLLTRPIQSLSRISRDIPLKIDRGETLYWPQSEISEVAELIENYSVTATTLENKLLESRERYKVLVDISPSGIWITDQAGKITYVSSKWTEITGLQSEEAMGNGWTNVIHPDDRESILKEWSSAVTNQSAFQAEYRLIGATGEMRWVWAIASVISETEQSGGWIGTITDITEAKKFENALRESEERLLLTLKGTKAGMWDWFVETDRIVFNDQWAEMLGYTLQELEPVSIKTWNDATHPDDLVKSNDILKRHFTGELDFYECETRMRHKNREWIWVLGRGMVTERGKDGSPIRVTGTHIDITDRKNKQQIEASLKEKEILLQEIHHRVKNNMAVVSSLLSLQASSLKDEKLKIALMDSQNRVQAMSLIHETLYQSKNLSSININQYLSKLAGTVVHSYSIGGKIDLKVDAEDIIIGVKQASPLGLIVNELISNSMKYAFPDLKDGKIAIELEKIGEEEIQLTYSDNGIGISKDLDWENTKSLGLHLVKLLGRGQLNGTVDLYRDRGTCFVIRFKLEENNLEKTMAETKILVVEDDFIIQDQLKVTLEELGYTVSETASKAEEAITKADTHRPDLVLMDINLEGDSDGIDAAANITRRFDIPIIYITAYTDADWLDRAKITHPYGYLVKPVQQRDLRVTIEMALYAAKMDQDRKRAEAEIKKQKNFLNNILESLTHPFYVIDANDYSVIMANSAAKLKESAEPKPCYALLHGRTEPCRDTDYQCPMSIIKESKQPVTLEHIHSDQNGNPIYEEVHGFPIYDEAGNITQMIEYCLDVTDRKQAEQTIREYGEKLRFHAEHSPLAVIEWNADFIITRWTGEAETIFGWRAEETIGNSFKNLNLYDQENMSDAEEILSRLTDGSTRHLIFSSRNVTKHGRAIHCEWYSSVLYDEEKK